MLSIADLASTLREHNARVLDQILHRRFGGQAPADLAIELSREHDHSARAESLFAPALTSHTAEDESFAETEHNAGTNKCSP